MDISFSGHRMSRIFLTHRFTKAWILLLEVAVSLHVSDPNHCRSTDLTLVLVLNGRLLQTDAEAFGRLVEIFSLSGCNILVWATCSTNYAS